MANNSILEATTRHQIWLQRLGSHFAYSFDPELKAADKIIREVLSRYTGKIPTAKIRDAIIKEFRNDLGGIYSSWTEDLIVDLEELAEMEAEFTAKNLGKFATAPILTPTVDQVLASIVTKPIQLNDNGESVLFKNFLKVFTPRQVERVNGVVRLGFSRGQTTAQMVQAIRGTKSLGFKDGVLSTTQRNAYMVARTATAHVANTAKQSVYKKNDDILEGWEFVATLDSRTSNICRHYDGEIFPIGEGPIAPLHPNCRSTSVPKLKSIFEILEGKETRASSGADGGKQVQDQSYYSWLRTQPKWFQQDVLGKSKTQLFRDGGLNDKEFKRLVSNNFGDPLTLDEIKRKDSRAWDNSGLDN